MSNQPIECTIYLHGGLFSEGEHVDMYEGQTVAPQHVPNWLAARQPPPDRGALLSWLTTLPSRHYRHSAPSARRKPRYRW